MVSHKLAGTKEHDLRSKKVSINEFTHIRHMYCRVQIEIFRKHYEDTELLGDNGNTLRRKAI
jgi:hypothetical protein